MNIPAIPPHNLLVLLAQLCVLLGTANLLGTLAARTGTPPVAGELLAGIILGPSLLGAVAPSVHNWLFPGIPAQAHMLDALGQFGALLLVGVTGVEMNLRLVRTRRRAITSVSVLGLALPLALGIAAGFLIPASLRTGHSTHLVFALFIGTAVCISSIPVVAKILSEMGLIEREVGQVVLASAMVDDVVAWLMLSVVAAMTAGSAGGGQVVAAVLKVAGVLVVAVLLRPLLRWLIARACAAGEGRAAAVVVIAVLGGAAATQALGLEAVLGAFVAGMVISTVPELEERNLTGLRGITMTVLAPIFLASAGLHVDMTVFSHPMVLATLGAMIVVAVGTKLGGAYAGARIGRLNHWDAFSVASGMNARGMVGIVAAGVGMRLGLLTNAMYAIIVTIAVLTSIATPPLMAWAIRRADPVRATLRAAVPVTESSG